jgi:hypothetical protein
VSRIVTTDFGRFNLVRRDGESVWLFECPGCGTWASLDDDQMNGRVSVDHAADGCTGGYHETHNYAAALQARIAMSRLLGQRDPFDPEPQAPEVGR